MIYAQIKAGRKLHLACQPGEEYRGDVIRIGNLSPPLCGTPNNGRYRMTINLPLAHACQRCQSIYYKSAA